MTDLELWKLAAQTGLSGLLVVVLGYVMKRVGERMIKAIDKVSDGLRDHTDKDLEHHARVREELVFLTARIEQANGYTPIHGVPVQVEDRRTPARGLPVGSYGPMRPSTRSDR